jgi:sugar transferase (PEP-CTERM system associated)
MVRLFHVYYPVRTLVLLLCEALIVGASFLAAALLLLGPDTYLALNYEAGALKIGTVVVLALFCSYYLDLYAPQRLPSKSEIYFRLLTVVGVLSIVLAAIAFFFPGFEIGRFVLLFGLVILTVVLLIWRSVYERVIALPFFREHVYVLGTGERAQRVVEAIRSRRDLGMEVMGWVGALGNGSITGDEFARALSAFGNRTLHVDRIVVALQDRRGTMPLRELLDLRLGGIKIEDVSSLLEKISGKIEIDSLQPSAVIFGEGFNVRRPLILARRLVSTLVAGSALLVLLPFIPLIALAVKLSSPGPVFFKQDRVGRRGAPFTLYKFRTMRQDAEAGTGAVWARKDDPRVTRVGRLLRKTRLDEVPQLWNVLKGDMGFVGPRPERPEFVKWLADQIPYYNLRHIVRPGLTGWAQVRYRYGATLEEAKQKLEYDLYYIKHMSVALDLLITFETLKTIVLRRGAQ